MDETARRKFSQQMLKLELVFLVIRYCLYQAFVLFAFGYFARLSVFLFNATAKWNTCCNAMLFPGNPDPLLLTLGGPAVLLVCSFVIRDVLAWRELFTNLYEPKSHI